MNEKVAESGLKLRLFSGLIMALGAIAVILINKYVFLAGIAVAALIVIYEWLNLTRKLTAPLLSGLAGFFYFSISFASFVYMRVAFEQGGWLALSTIFIVAASDIGAYFTGKLVGGPKLAPKISPKKTWAGFAGAVIWAGIACPALLYAGGYVDPYLAQSTDIQHANLWGFLPVGCIMGAMGQAGDLLISFSKRKAGIKDTGHLIPGHGGLLDRIDGLLLVSPVFTVFLWLWLT